LRDLAEEHLLAALGGESKKVIRQAKTSIGLLLEGLNKGSPER